MIMTNGSKSASNGEIPSRLRRFLQKPWRQKGKWLGREWQRLTSKVPKPVRLPFGAVFLSRSDSLGANLSRFETKELAFAERFLQPTMTVLDVGAHQGLYTLLAAKRVGPSGRVFSFEPSPRERRALRMNLALNFCRNVAVQPVALGDQEATADLFVVDEYNTGYNSLRPPSVPQPTTRIAVPVRTLDNWASEKLVGRVDFIKLDVEGAELSVLKGAIALLTRTHPVLLVEVADARTIAWGYPAEEIVRFLRSIGYDCFQILDNAKLESVPEASHGEMNVVAIPRGHQ